MKGWREGLEGLEGWRGSRSYPEELLSHRFTPTRVPKKKGHSLSKGAKVQRRQRKRNSVLAMGAVVP